MTEQHLEALLERIGNDDRSALQELVQATATPVSLMLSHEGHPPGGVRKALVLAYAELWRGEYAVPLLPGDSLQGWITKLARHHVPRTAPSRSNASIVDESLWPEVAKEAFPESLRNLWRRSEIGFILIGALIWGLILLFLQ